MADQVNSFVSVNYDEMEEKTTYDMSYNIRTGGALDLNGVKLRRVEMKDFDSTLLDAQYMGEDWLFLRNGEITLNCDSKLTKIKFTESNTEVGYLGMSGVMELGYYKLSKKIVKTIADADSLKIRISSGAGYSDLTPNVCSSLALMCKRFYHEVFDDKLYKDAMELQPGESAGGGSGGCFVATATMGHYDHPTVLELRRFRDGYLRNSVLGRAFIKTYYKVGPYPAAVIRKSAFLRKVSLSFIIEPLRKVASKLYKG